MWSVRHHNKVNAVVTTICRGKLGLHTSFEGPVTLCPDTKEGAVHRVPLQASLSPLGKCLVRYRPGRHIDLSTGYLQLVVG